jgi:hypothetical protein
MSPSTDLDVVRKESPFALVGNRITIRWSCNPESRYCADSGCPAENGKQQINQPSFFPCRLMTPSVSRLCTVGRWNDTWILMHWKGFGGKWSRYYPGIFWRDWGRPRKNSVRIADGLADILTPPPPIQAQSIASKPDCSVTLLVLCG